MLQCRAGHYNCRDCLRNHFIHRTFQWIHVDWDKCLRFGCKAGIPSPLLVAILDERLLSAYDQLYMDKAFANVSDIYFKCPHCGYGSEVPFDSGVVACHVCAKSVCRICEQPPHPGDLCEPGMLYTQDMLLEEKEHAIFRCKNNKCQSRQIMSQENGCNKLICPVCQHALCTQCGKGLSADEHAYSHFCRKNPAQCVRNGCKDCHMFPLQKKG